MSAAARSARGAVRELRARAKHSLRPLVRPVVVRRRHRGLRADDLVLASFPKSGSTWLRFALAGALSGREMDFDLVREVSPPVGDHRNGPLIVPPGGRFVKSHELPFFSGPTTARPKVISLVRDGRDIGISYYHHLRRRGLAAERFDAFWDDYLSGRVGVFGSWQGFVRRWLDYGATANVLTVRYEDLLDDAPRELRRINEHFALGLSDQTIDKALQASTPDGMRAKEAGSRLIESRTTSTATSFVREAKAGSWVDELSSAACDRFEAVAGRELTDLGYPLRADLA